MTPLLVGRADELETMRAAGQRLAAGEGTFVHVNGEAGIGKTTLLALLASELERLPVTLRSAAADETDRRRRLVVLRALLPEATFDLDGDAIDTAVGSIEHLAGTGPLALLVDDLHWADDLSVDTLRAIARRADRLGILLVTTARPTPASPAVRRLEELASTASTCVRLEPLGPSDLSALAEATFGGTVGPRLETLLAGTAGNPFLASELMASLVDDARVAGDGQVIDLTDDAPVPGGLSRRLAGRALASVPGGELFLRAVAAVPGGTTPEELAVILEHPLTDVLDQCLAAVDAGVLVDTGTALTFRHELLRRSVLDATPTSIMRTLSRRAADVLVERRVDPERATACLLAGTDTEDPSDVDRLVAVGSSFCNGHPAAAADLLRRALDGMSHHDKRSPEVALQAGWALVAAGRAREVEGLIADRFGPPRDDELIGLSRLRGIAGSLAGRMDAVADRYGDLDVAGLMARFDTDDADVVDATAELALLRISTGRVSDAAELVDWVDASPTPASPFRSATVATVRSWITAVTGQFEAGVAHAREALAHVERDDTRRASAATPTLTLAVSLDQLGECDQALAVARDRSAKLAVPRWGPPLLQFFAAISLYRRGDWDDALAEVEAGLIAAEDADVAMATFWPHAVAALISSARGQQPQAQEWLVQADTNAVRVALGREWLAYAAALATEANGDLAGAATIVEGAAGALIGVGAPAMLLNGGADMVRLCMMAGRNDAARAIEAELRAMSSRTASPVVSGLSQWAGGLVDGSAARVSGAGETLFSCGRRPEASRAHHHAAVLAAQAGDREEARRLAKAAAAGYDALDADQWRRQLRAELHGVGVDLRPRRGGVRPASGWASLTASEQTVVGLVGEGLTNTEIAGRLFVSRRTVESHLGRIYAKLALSTRAQLVAAVARRPGQ